VSFLAVRGQRVSAIASARLLPPDGMVNLKTGALQELASATCFMKSRFTRELQLPGAVARQNYPRLLIMVPCLQNARGKIRVCPKTPTFSRFPSLTQNQCLICNNLRTLYSKCFESGIRNEGDCDTKIVARQNCKIGLKPLINSAIKVSSIEKS